MFRIRAWGLRCQVQIEKLDAMPLIFPMGFGEAIRPS